MLHILVHGYTKVVGLLALVALTVLLGLCSWFVVEATLTVQAWRALPDRVVAMMDARLASIETKADAQLTAARGQLSGIPGKLDARLATIQDDLNSQIALTRIALLAEVHPASVAATDALAAYAALPRSIQPTVAAVNAQSPVLLRRFGDTLSQTRITMLETSQTMHTVRDAAPEMAKAVTQGTKDLGGIAADGRIIADRITKPKRWYQRLWEEVKTAAMIGAHFL
jgi:hypothetical protein